MHECWIGPCTVELRPNAQAPVWRLPVLEPLEGFFWRANFTLVAGARAPRLPGAARVTAIACSVVVATGV